MNALTDPVVACDTTVER